MTSLTDTVRTDSKNAQLKRALIDCVNEETGKFVAIAEDFYSVHLRSDEHYSNLCQAIVDTVDQVLASGKWEESLFLRNTIKSLSEIREHAIELRQQVVGAAKAEEWATPEVSGDCVALYVSLYQANGHDLKQWAEQLSALSRYMVGRPVYRNEEDVMKVIRLRSSQISEAYVLVAVKEAKIISGGNVKPRKDRFENELMNLAPGAISSSSILEFVHQDKHYYFKNHQLFLKEQVE